MFMHEQFPRSVPLPQVVISGAVTVASRLSQHLEVKLISSRPIKESSSVLGAGQTLPSYVGEQEEIKALRVRLVGVKAPWSQEIAVSKDKSKDSRLVKVRASQSRSAEGGIA